jgi:hypothetical protein
VEAFPLRTPVDKLKQQTIDENRKPLQSSTTSH